MLDQPQDTVALENVVEDAEHRSLVAGSHPVMHVAEGQDEVDGLWRRNRHVLWRLQWRHNDSIIRRGLGQLLQEIGTGAAKILAAVRVHIIVRSVVPALITQERRKY